MPELRYYLAPMLTGVLYGTTPHRTHPFFRSRLNPTGPQVAHVSMMPLGKRDIGILAVTAEPAEHDAFVAAGAGVELPHRRNMRLADMSRLRDVLPLALIDSRIQTGTPGWQAIRYLGRTAQFLQRIHGQFGADLLDADRTRFAELGERYAALKDEPAFRTRLEGAVDLWPELLPLRLGVGVDLGFEPLVQGGALPGSDAFTNSNGTNLSTHNSLWVQLGGGTAWTIQSNQARVPIDFARRFAYWNETWANDQWARATASNRGTYSQGPAVRIQTSGVNGVEWLAELWNGSGIYLTVVVGGSGTDIDEYLSGASAGVILELQAEGTTFRGYTGSTPVERTNATDSTYSSGKGGMAGYNDAASSGVYLDNWAGDDLSSGPVEVGLAGAQPVSTGALSVRRTLTHKSLAGAQPAATGDITAEQFEALAGAQPAATGDITAKQFDTLAGAQPAPSGTLAKKYLKMLAGAQPAASGTLAKRYNKTLAGAQPASSGTIAAQQTLVRALAGDQPAATGSVNVGVNLAGAQPAATGAIAAQQSLARSLAGAQPAASGDITTLQYKALAGAQPSATGTIDAEVGTILVNLAGAQPASTGTLAAFSSLARTLSGAQPASSGALALRYILVHIALVGLQPASTGTLAAFSTLARSLAGAQPAGSGTIAAVVGDSTGWVEITVTISPALAIAVTTQPALELTTEFNP